MGTPKDFVSHHTRSYISRATRNSKLVNSSGGQKRINTGKTFAYKGKRCTVFRDLKDGVQYKRIKLDPIDETHTEDPEIITSAKEIIREGFKNEIALYIILPSGIYKRVPSSKKNDEYIIFHGIKINIEDVDK